MTIKNVPANRLGEIVAGLVREGIMFNAVPEDDRASSYTITMTGGY